MCVTDPWAHMGLVHSILSLKLGVTVSEQAGWATGPIVEEMIFFSIFQTLPI